jgi:4-hydroxybenzoate polyprenyltransferase
VTDAPANPILILSRDIKVSHTIFAMPFALLATFVAADGFCGWTAMGLILICMVAARTFAMLCNRYVDRTIDARNPRTAGRALASGSVSTRAALTALVISGLGLVAAAAGFWIWGGNAWPLTLSPLVLLWVGAYGYFKRFTALCHFFLGSALAISPLAAAIAIDPSSLNHPTLWWLSGFVLLWVGGFDIIYAMQDLEVDRSEGLHSIPAKLGKSGALNIAKSAHLLALMCLVMCRHSNDHFTDLFGITVAVVAVVLVIEHWAASKDRFSMAFFTFNGLISLMLGTAGIVDILR